MTDRLPGNVGQSVGNTGAERVRSGCARVTSVHAIVLVPIGRTAGAAALLDFELCCRQSLSEY